MVNKIKNRVVFNKKRKTKSKISMLDRLLIKKKKDRLFIKKGLKESNTKISGKSKISMLDRLLIEKKNRARAKKTGFLKFK